MTEEGADGQSLCPHDGESYEAWFDRFVRLTKDDNLPVELRRECGQLHATIIRYVIDTYGDEDRKVDVRLLN